MKKRIVFAKQRVAFGSFALGSSNADQTLLASIFGNVDGRRIRTDFALYHDRAEIDDFLARAKESQEDWSICYIDDVIPSDVSNILSPLLKVISPLTPIFTLAAYDSDFVLMPSLNQQKVEVALRRAGYEVGYLEKDITTINSSSIAENTECAIKHFSLSDLSLQSGSLDSMGLWKSDLEPDNYLVRQAQIERLISFAGVSDCDEVLTEYYLTGSTAALDRALLKFPEEICEEVRAMDPSRFRSIAAFNIAKSGKGWEVYDALPGERRITFPGQALGKVDESRLEFRKYPRSFKKTDLEIQMSEEVGAFLMYILHSVGEVNPDLWFLSVMMHLTDNRVADASRIVSNSPEGIHQDGFPYIVSAFVIERKNIEGAESQIFTLPVGSKKYVPVLESTLMPGNGIFQPDSGTDLWHLVTPMTPVKGKVGSRFTVGFDIDTHNNPFGVKYQKPLFSLPGNQAFKAPKDVSHRRPFVTPASQFPKIGMFTQQRAYHTVTSLLNGIRRMVK